MDVRMGAVVLFFLSSFAMAGVAARAGDPNARTALNVAVNASSLATVAVLYSAGADITCRVPPGATGFVPCGTATISGIVRTPPSARSVSISLANVPSTVRLTCAGEAVGRSGGCAAWRAPWIGRYQIPVAATVDARAVPAGSIVHLHLEPAISLLL